MRFVILTCQRSGSHMVSSALNSHPEIHCVGEVDNIDPLNNVYGEIKHYNQDPDLDKYDRIIHLIRDPESVAMSRQSQRISHEPHNLGDQKHETHELDGEQVKKEAQHIKEIQDEMRLRVENLDHLEVNYEDIVENGYDNILDYLEVDIIPLKSGYKKLNRTYVIKG